MPIKQSRKSSDINYSPDWIQAIHGFHFLTLTWSNMAMNFSQNLFRSIKIYWHFLVPGAQVPKRAAQESPTPISSRPATLRSSEAEGLELWNVWKDSSHTGKEQPRSKYKWVSTWPWRMQDWLGLTPSFCCHLDHFSRDVSHTLVAIQRKHGHEGGDEGNHFLGGTTNTNGSSIHRSLNRQSSTT